ncbi:50S ribosomal protein L25/general stress protein Ctc [uncultured Cocleimonas sp.]|uniref:50S ribosomal protein L25/general stress protein Ctc n=1 Tax=uncultured Cocleimonas sp. TaxID=1051587 RepID=UPI002607DAA2|nr:50S ribosomal protein L25/general stress protein Ctc [uncultured Cocleimonas sp.]
MAAKYELAAEMREDLGKGASRRLRRVNKIPAVLYGAGRPAWSLTLNENQLMRNLQEESFYAAIIELTLEGKQQKVFLRDLQRHPAKPFVLHVDLQRVRDDVEMTVVLPLHILNEDTAHGVKMEGGVVTRNLSDIEVVCLPGNLPEYIEVDLADLKLGESLHLSDIKFPEGVSSTELSHGEDHDHLIVSIHAPRAEEVIEDEAPEAPATEADDEEAEGGDDA